MKRMLLALCVLLCCCTILAAPARCDSVTINGVLAEEKIVNLPQDAGKWYVSVVGDPNDPQYQTIIKWFDTHAKLQILKDQVHFNPVTSDSAMYQERYRPNVSGLPTVRLQRHDGETIYEAAKENIPFTADGLYGAIADSVNKVQQRKYVLPYRRNNHEQPDKTPSPTPSPDDDPVPQPIDEGKVPVLPPPDPSIELPNNLPALPLMLAVFILAAVAGTVLEYRRKNS